MTAGVMLYMLMLTAANIPRAELPTLNISTVFKAWGLCFVFSFLLTDSTCGKRCITVYQRSTKVSLHSVWPRLG